MLENSYQTVPSYSGSVFIMAHEFGHLFGSYHTHACAWNGDNTAIDGCQSTEDVGFGFCSLPGIPPEGGTIMSYCTNQSVGVNFNLGFGPQPGNVIRSSVANAACLCECVNSTISGPDYLCSTNTFTLQNVPVGSTVSWSVSPTHLFSGSTSGNGTNASLSPASWGSSGQATLTFSIEGDCGTVESSTEFWVGRAISYIEGPYEMAINTVENYFATGNPYMGITDYQWSLFPSGYHWIGNQGTNAITLSFSATGLYSLELDVVNPCGARGSEIGIYVYNPWEHFTLYPNPTSDILHISMDLETRGRDVDLDFEVSLFDGQGRELIPAKQAHQEASLDLSRIPKGFYYVHIRYRDALLRRQIRVER
ncbi:Por secretion system C-terminal sorting domain-containing protein [Aquiflexum balticum DSM 16537]|uniref:Por secretion system C-terminal sorting domain-containing protein n=2 Tax=Aquiflexum TaxID=280472 RepID=A0A1W2HAE8_9BACT|nr:Por secretion system C-terminal sorting domain-containing protein [Aquiflexum balticum DSM 16537]